MARTIFDDYFEFTKNQVSPTNFHFWVCASLIGGVLERRVWVDQYYYKVFPNLYVILVSDSALCAKTTALEIGVNNFLRPLKDKKKKPQVYIVSDKLTPQFLYEAISSEGVKTLVRHSGRQVLTKEGIQTARPVFLTTGELGMMFSRDAVEGGVIDKLTHLYTCPPVSEYNTKTAGNYFVYYPCINLLSAVTPDWLERNIDKNRYGEGMMGRVTFVFSNEPREDNYQSRPVASPETEAAKPRVLKHLERIAQLRGKFSWGEGAGEAYDKWSVSHRLELKNRDAILDFLSSGFWGRQPDLVITLALILSAGRSSRKIITKKDIRDAIREVDKVRAHLVHVFSIAAISGGDPFVARVEEFLLRKGSATRSEVTKAMGRFMKTAISREALTRLVGTGRIKKVRTLGGGDRFEIKTN